MPLIQWCNELSVGISSIDEQHKKLINLINILDSSFVEGKANDVLADIFDELTTYTIKHFGYEEELFAQYDYAEYKTHKDEHEELIKQVLKLQKKNIDGDFLISLEVLVFLKNWLLNHIMKTDKAYASFLIDEGAV
jgi:hemerythrin